jgi:hypothetical protein
VADLHVVAGIASDISHPSTCGTDLRQQYVSSAVVEDLLKICYKNSTDIGKSSGAGSFWPAQGL